MKASAKIVWLVVASLGTGTLALAADAFQVDTVHSSVQFRVKHMNVSYAYGRFNDVSGKFLLDEADFGMNRAAFAENGYSKGMFYNTYCNARVTLSWNASTSTALPEAHQNMLPSRCLAATAEHTPTSAMVAVHSDSSIAWPR